MERKIKAIVENAFYETTIWHLNSTNLTDEIYDRLREKFSNHLIDETCEDEIDNLIADKIDELKQYLKTRDRINNLCYNLFKENKGGK